jgi:hypothetical protein
MKEKGFNYIFAIAKVAEFKKIAIRYTAVIPAQNQVTLQCPISLRGLLKVCALPFDNLEPKDV